MTAPPAPSTPIAPPDARRLRRALLDALRRNDLDAADAALAQLPGDATPADLLEPVAMAHLARRRWADAAAALGRLPRRDANLDALHTYARNLAALHRHRPAVHDALLAAPPSDAFEVVRPPAGPPGIVHRARDGRATPVTPGGDVAVNLARIRSMIEPLRQRLQPIGLAGVGDGYAVTDLAASPARSSLGAEQAVLVIEPDAALLSACLMLHDWSGDAGPIASPRFYWCVGEGWAAELRRLADDEPCLALPTQLVSQSPQAPRIIEGFQAVARRLESDDDAVRRDIGGAYRARSAADFARAIRGDAGRPPRALLVTSRFTTVLQFSTRDAAAALERLGWRTRVLIEPAAHLQLTVRHIRRQVADFRPDLVVILDHLRHEYGDLFPPELPFVCWIQDNLANLTTAAAGRSVSRRDFVIGAWVRNYVRDHAYPQRQCIELPRLTNAAAASPPAAPASPDGDDLVYVSNHAQLPPAKLDEVARSLAGRPHGERLAREAGARMLAAYDAGGVLYERREVKRLVDETAESLGLAGDADLHAAAAWLLFDRVNNALYRQQALGWAADAADALGLRLAIYGAGWDRHPRFAPYARGPIAYGDALADATRRARFSLMLEPYFATSHQRVLDGWAAGGFFLLRRRPIDTLQAQWMAWLDRLPPDALTLDDARRALPPEDFAAFEPLHRTMHALDPSYASLNLVALHRERQRDGLGFLMTMPPGYDAVAFADRAELELRIRHFLAHPQERAALADAQRRFVLSHFTYDAGFARVAQRVAERLEAERDA